MVGVVIEAIAFDHLRLVVAPSLGEVLVVLGELRGHGVHGGRVLADDDVLGRRRAATTATPHAVRQPRHRAELGNTYTRRQTEIPPSDIGAFDVKR